MAYDLKFGDNSPVTPTRDSPVDLQFSRGVTPDTGSITFEGLVPIVRLNMFNHTTPGAMTFTGLAPLIFHGQRAEHQTGTITFSGLAPIVRLNMFNHTLPGSLAFTGQPPAFVHGFIWKPETGSATFTGLPPRALIDSPSYPPPGTLILSGSPPELVFTYNQIYKPPAGALTFTGAAPSVGSEKPILLASPANLTVTEGQAAGFTVIVTSPYPITYQWYETTAGLIPGETATQYTITATEMPQNGTGYYCVVTDTYNQFVTSTTATLTVQLDTVLTHAGGNVPVLMMLSGGQGNEETLKSIGGPASKGPEGLTASQIMGVAGLDPLSTVYLYGGTGLALGLGILRWDPATGKLTFTDSATNTTEIEIGPVGYYWSRSNPGQFLAGVRGPMPAVMAHTNYLVSDWQQNLFDHVTFSERAANHANYRCVYLQNNTTYTLANISVRVRTSPKYGTVHVATEYPSNAGVNAADAHYVEANAVQRGGTLVLGAHTEELVTDYVDFTFKGGPFLRPAYELIRSNNVSDGSTVQVAAQLVDENDSTDVLAGVSWGDTITWKNIPSGSFVSFWVRRDIRASTSGSLEELDNFTMDTRYERNY
jgi:hypothetical protein